MNIDLDRHIPGAPHFLWREALYLRDWAFSAYPELKTARHIIAVAHKLELIRGYLGRPIHVTSWYRPGVYNRKIGGAKNSAHLYGMAVDFQVGGMNADMIRAMLRPKLETLKIRMENLPYSTWTHIDTREPSEVGGRFFRP